MKDFLINLQDRICKKISDFDQKTFKKDLWTRPGGGGGDTRIFSDGKFLEKGGVNFSEVFGDLNPDFAKSMPLGDGNTFYATGVSLVLHPINPFVPTVHANFRMIQRGSQVWFGGGADLTPYYVFEEDAKHFHQTFKTALDGFGKNLYQDYKKHCDEYFYLPHRGETRGVGGIFFDYLLKDDPWKEEMVRACANAFLDAYFPIVEKRIHLPFNEKQKEFQEIRRGRYVEFNLLYDRGTTFGLKTNGRIESILMSLPLKARWVYDYKPEKNSQEEQLFQYLSARNWVS